MKIDQQKLNPIMIPPKNHKSTLEPSEQFQDLNSLIHLIILYFILFNFILFLFKFINFFYFTLSYYTINQCSKIILAQFLDYFFSLTFLLRNNLKNPTVAHFSIQ